MSKESKFKEDIRYYKGELKREKMLFEELLELKRNPNYISEIYTDLK